MSARLGWALALSLALHAVLVVGYVRPHRVSGSTMASQALQFRVIHSSAREDSAGQEAGSTTAPSTELGPGAVSRPLPSGNSAAEAAVVAPSSLTRGEMRRDPEVATASTSAATALTPAPSYRASGELDPPPRPLQSIDPVYPESAGMQEGSVVLRLLIGSSGEVDEVAVVRATPPGLFEQSALQAFAKARFSPGYFLGIAVKSQIFIEVGYTPINRGGAVSGQSR